MTPCEHRLMLLELIGQSCESGARLHKACAVIGLHAGTVGGGPFIRMETFGSQASTASPCQPTSSATLSGKLPWR